MIDIIKSISTVKNFIGNASRITCNEYLHEALTDAIESMERDVPVNPIRVSNDRTDGCPICKTEFYEKVNFCSNCGKKMDWRK